MKEDIRKELEEIAPNLAKLDNNQQYKVPEGYFDSLPGIVQDRIIAEKPVNPVFDWLKEILNARVVVPAFVLLIAIGGGWYYDNVTSTASTDDYLSYDYISNSVYFEDFEDDILFDELLADNGIENLQEEALFSDQDIENYLMSSQLNESVILNEL